MCDGVSVCVCVDTDSVDTDSLRGKLRYELHRIKHGDCLSIAGAICFRCLKNVQLFYVCGKETGVWD